MLKNSKMLKEIKGCSVSLLEGYFYEDRFASNCLNL